MGRVLAIVVAVLCAAPPVAAERAVPETRAQIDLSFAPVVKAAAPAVVNIYATRVVAEQSPFAGDPFFSQFFGDLGRPRQRLENALGSGVIVSGDGFVVSNAHVVAGARDIRVVLADRREFAGRIVLSDKEADLAVIRLEAAEDLPVLPMGDSDAMEVGDLVLAIGNPFGVGQTVSGGIVSALARSVGGKGPFVQTDAPINPGNSGGALVDMAGRLVGINTSILSRSGGSNGIGFAIPTGLVRAYVAAARDGKDRLERPWLGAELQAVDMDLAEALGLDAPLGLLITALHAQSPLAGAGLEVGDVVAALDGHPVAAPGELAYRMVVAGGGQASLEAMTGQGRRDVVLELAPPPDDPPADPRTAGGPNPLRGLRAATVNPRLIEKYGLPLDAAGAVVVQLAGYAARSGLRPGDVIRGINGRRIESAADFAAATSGAARLWDIAVRRDGRHYTLRLAG